MQGGSFSRKKPLGYGGFCKHQNRKCCNRKLSKAITPRRKQGPLAVCVALRRHKPAKQRMRKRWAKPDWKAGSQPDWQPGLIPGLMLAAQEPARSPDRVLNCPSHCPSNCVQIRAQIRYRPSSRPSRPRPRHSPSRRPHPSRAHQSRPKTQRASCGSPRHGVPPAPPEHHLSTRWDSCVRREYARIGPSSCEFEAVSKRISSVIAQPKVAMRTECR